LKESADNLGLLYSKGREFECPHVELPDTYEEYLGQLGSSTRAKIRRDSRRLQAHGDVRFRRTENREELEVDFDEFARLHTVRWNSRNCPGSFETGLFKEFLKSMAIDLLETDSLDLLFLEIDGRPAAALYNMRYNNRISFLQSGLDSEVASDLSPGLLLHDNSIHDAIDSGVREYDFLMMGATDTYKKRLAKESRFLCDIYLARPGLLNSLKRFEVKAKQFINSLRERNSGTATPDKG
ncbi:MAG: GNAT family N-acetyltransferase, partial [Proteobacteria bacterium]|nr:GNAT family N-acetyltransferase [Pseudomonadota bacterium]